MKQKYYLVRDNRNSIFPTEQEILVCINNGNLETLVGQSTPKDFGCYVDKNGSLKVNGDYEFSEINPSKVEALRGFMIAKILGARGGGMLKHKLVA